MKARTAVLLVGTILLAGLVAYVNVVGHGTTVHRSDSMSVVPLPASPLDATYRINDEEVTLADGVATRDAAPGSAAKVITSVFGTPIHGDLNGDGAPDAAVLLTQDGGGSGTFYYAAAALKDGDGYLGTNAVLLGDRIAPPTLEMRYGMLIARYAAHGPDEPFTATATVAVSKYVTLSGATLTDAGSFEEGALVLPGTLTFEDETGTFSTCSGDTYTLSDDSRALAALRAVYVQRAGTEEGAPVFVVVVGHVMDATADTASGGGADSFAVTRILSAPADASCGDDELLQGGAPIE